MDNRNGNVEHVLLRQVPLMTPMEYMQLAENINRETGFAIKYMCILRKHDNTPNTLAFLRFYADIAHQFCVDQCNNRQYFVDTNHIRANIQFEITCQFVDHVVDRFPDMLVYEVDAGTNQVYWNQTQRNAIYNSHIDQPRPNSDSAHLIFH